MKLKKLKGKGKRWKKGSSCLSNPENKQFRAAAKLNTFQQVEGESSLTKDALAKHNDGLYQVSQKLDTLNVNEDDYKSTGRTFNTFATNFTSCTIPAFENFFKYFDVKSSLHTKMLAIHAAAQEYITDASIPETPTSYLCALMASLEGIKDNPEDVTATLSLMKKVIRKAPENILKIKFLEFSKLLEEILAMYQDSNQVFIINIIGCLSVLLRCQIYSQWNTNSTMMNILENILSYSLHENPKIRKCAQYNVSAILRASSFMLPDEIEGATADGAPKTPSIIHPGAALVGKFVISNLKAASEGSNAKTTLHLLVFLQQTIGSFPKKTLKNVCEIILGVMHIGDALVVECALKALRSLVKTKPVSVGLNSEINAALIGALTRSPKDKNSHSLNLIPHRIEESHCAIWISTVTALLTNLFKSSESEGVKYIADFFHELMPYYKSDSSLIHEEIFYCFECLLEECLQPLSNKISSTYAKEVTHLFEAVEKGLSLQYQQSWAFIFRSLSVCFKVIGPELPHIMVDCLKNLQNMANNPEVVYRSLLELAIGNALNGIGPDKVLEVIPLQITGNLVNDQVHFWILPVIQRYVKNTKVSFFFLHFFPLAEKCSLLLEQLVANGQGETQLAKTYKSVELQIWSLLPSFADGATDAPEAISLEIDDLKKISKMRASGIETHSIPKKIFGQELCVNLRRREDTRLYAMSALRNMVLASKDRPGKLAEYAKNYLPALFALYTCRPHNYNLKHDSVYNLSIDPGHRLSAYSTIEIYLSITPDHKREELFAKALSKSFEDESDEFKQLACLSLVRAFIPYLDVSNLEQLYLKISPLISEKKTNLQKSAYRIMENILSVDTESSNLFISSRLEDIGKLLLPSFLFININSKASRLRCLRHVLGYIPCEIDPSARDKIFEQIVNESVLCCGELNSVATRKAAFNLLSAFNHHVERITGLEKENAVYVCVEFLFQRFSCPPVLMQSNAILAMTASLYYYKDHIEDDIFAILVKNVSMKLLVPDRNFVKSALKFLRVVFIIFPIDKTSEQVETVMHYIVKMKEDFARKFRLKTRDLLSSLIRKFGPERILALIPKANIVLNKRVKNIIKSEMRKKKSKETTDKESDDSDVEEERKEPTSLDEILAEIDADIDGDDILKKTNEKSQPRTRTKGKKKKVWINETEDDIIDLLDPSSSAGAFTKKDPRNVKAAPPQRDENYGFKVDEHTGKFIITEEKEKPSEKDTDTEALEDLKDFMDLKGAEEGKIRKRKRRFSNGSDDDDVSAEPPNKASSAGPSKRKGSKFDYGSEFRSRKAGGDVAKKGNVAPYAYVQFTKDKLNKRKKAKYAGQFKSLVRGAKKGAVKGKKLRKKS